MQDKEERDLRGATRMKRIMQLICATFLSLSMFTLNAGEWVIIPVAAAETCSTVEACNDAKAAIAEKKAGLQTKIDSAKTDASAQYEAIYAIQEKTELLESEIAVLNESIQMLHAKEMELAEQIKATEDALLSRYKMQQTEGTTNPFLFCMLKTEFLP